MTLEEFLAEWCSPSPTVLVHTSGSTGTPKPMYVEKQRMLNSARITCDFLGLKPGDTALLCMPLDFIAGKMVVVRAIERHLKLLYTHPTGHPFSDNTTYTLYDFSKEEPHVVAISPKEASSFAALVPLQVYNSLSIPTERTRLEHIDQLIIGGGAIDGDLQRQLRDFPHSVWSTYGMTETLSHIALRRLNGPTASEYYQPFDSVKVSLNDDGCLVIDAPLVHDGPLVTNDRAEIIPGRGFRILGRKDNVIDSGGIKIQIEEVEKVLRPLLSAPYAITKAPDKKFGEQVVLLSEDPDTAALAAICRAHLPKYWQPKRIVHVEQIPMTKTGKIARADCESLVKQS
ncbi:MAG: AMP-binding protein [Prevotella sp.]|uniref:AMP-binding protein n=1 Tax=Prevotella sp. AGR2160 TaxID=1280674 RepID=UPI00048BD52A|nr:AMP-binding protein [Prevotella sp. AGR2160]MDD5861866.1 AMP-binding protein [Prevotella sp.]